MYGPFYQNMTVIQRSKYEMLLALVFEIITFLLHWQCYNYLVSYIEQFRVDFYVYNFFFLSIKINELIPEWKMIENSWVLCAL